MKKIFRLFAAIAASTLAFSCMEEAAPEAGIQNGGSQYDGPMTTITFSLDDLETKTAWDGENFTWSEGDKIKIIYGTEDNAYTVAEVVDGTVTATVGDVDTYYAVYPETTAYVLETPEGTEEPQFSVTIPRVQDGSFQQANVMAAKTSASEKILAFKNLTHILKFDLSEGCEYNIFRFRSNSSGDDVRMGATPSLVTFDENDDDVDDLTVGIPVAGGHTGYGVVSLSEDAIGPFYFGVRAGTDLEGGFGVLASKTGKEGGYTGGLLTTTTVTTTRSKITNLGTLDAYISDDWYITATGTGSGKSWADPAGIDLLVKLMQNKTSAGETYVGNGTTDIYRLIDAKIHVAAGTYNLYTANENSNFKVAGLAFDAADRYKSTKITIIGGYPETPSEGDKPSIGENGSATIFTTDVTTTDTSNPRMFNFDNVTIGYLAFDGLTFKAEDVNAVGMVNFTNNVIGKATFNNCYFSVQSRRNAGGSALRVTAGGNCSIDCNNCKFIDNTSTSDGGAFYKSDTNASIKFNNCSFTSNSAANGGAVYLATAKNVEFEQCVFSENSATNGGAIYNQASTVILDNCLFTGNSAISDGNGAAIYAVDSINSDDYTAPCVNMYVYDSSFYKNGSAKQGVLRINGVGYLALVNSTFDSNTFTGNGDIFLRTDQAATDRGVKAYIISCTATNAKSLYSQACNCYCYNSVFNGYYANGNTAPNTVFNYSIFTNKHGSKDNLQPGLYLNDNETSDDVTDYSKDLFGTYTDGVIPVGGAALTNGMSSTDLAALGAEGSALMTAMPLFDATKLTVDQKGNSREGKTVMGAYVGE